MKGRTDTDQKICQKLHVMKQQKKERVGKRECILIAVALFNGDFWRSMKTSFSR